ncbi:EscU/YscU/HrcU family type III secretion system export apparatus switch protein [Acanthopleuribacter pedis]|uniref:Flagellar biosynthetic protein FlhB n=1 Tax=Acanthopleuribacter pedis TaxID=442870 RepID=A0A8J7QE59_9BACT|nr:EscU/YscU/HrcU family type III secretion system export apparatus switch protein [Acanthopleuribacter pedis]
MSAADEGRTEKGSAKKREKQREEGNVLKSQEVNTAMQYLAGLVALSFFGGGLGVAMSDVMAYVLTVAPYGNLQGEINSISWFYSFEFVAMLTPFFSVLMIAALASNISQVGFMISWTPLKPKLTKLNVFANFKRIMFSSNSVMELVKSIAKIGVLSYLITIAAMPHLADYLGMLQLTPMLVVMRVWEVAYAIWIMIIIFMVVIAVADYAYQWYKHEDQLKMSKSDVKDEQKQALGDMQAKAKMRQLGVQRLMNIMAENAANADVVITNPTHFAVALVYDQGNMVAPKVVAKGVDHVALRIRKRARSKNIPIVENRALARGLYYAAEIGQDIPEIFFRPVAEILAFVYKLNKKRAHA